VNKKSPRNDHRLATLACIIYTHAYRNYALDCHNHIHACQNHTLRVKITIVRVEITVVSVVITFVRDKVTIRVEITLCVYKSHSSVSLSHS
jgi:hypothetical protein